MKSNILIKGFIYITGILVFSLYTQAQLSTGEIPYGIIAKLSTPHNSVVELSFANDAPRIDTSIIAKEIPMYAGVSIPVKHYFKDMASQVALPDGSYLWRAIIKIDRKAYLGLVLSDFQVYEDDKFFIYTSDHNHYIGAFTSKNYSTPSPFSSHVLPSNDLVLEYQTNNFNRDSLPAFFIEELIYIHNGGMYESDDNGLKASGSCNVNINCPEGDDWQKQKRGVARILLRSGTTWYNCTGSLVNNTAEDGTPYFLTADHCGVSSSEADLQVWQFYFNYEYSQCNNTGTTPQNMMVTGAQVLAKAPIQNGTDFKLLLLNQTPELTWNPYYNGWSRSARSSAEGVSIHHPSGDAKKVSTYTSELVTSTFTGGMPMAYWRVFWAETESGHGITEGGSSGSPIFESNGLITGTLTGGSASCTKPTLPDYYGKFYMHWEENGETNAQRLEPWLDPDVEDPEMLYGFDPNAATNFVLITVDPPKAGTTTGAGYYAEGEVVLLEANVNVGYVFKSWKNGAGVIVSNQPSYSFIMPQTEVELTAVFDTLIIGIKEILLPFDINIFPNPTSGDLNIHFNEPTQSIQILISSMSGQMIYLENHNQISAGQTIGISEQLAPGVYVLSITGEKGKQQAKIVAQ